jgi:hypothetical protein
LFFFLWQERFAPFEGLPVAALQHQTDQEHPEKGVISLAVAVISDRGHLHDSVHDKDVVEEQTRNNSVGDVCEIMEQDWSVEKLPHVS